MNICKNVSRKVANGFTLGSKLLPIISVLMLVASYATASESKADNGASSEPAAPSHATPSFPIPRGILSHSGKRDPIAQEILDNPTVTGFLVLDGWKQIEPTEGNFDWSFIDSEVQRAEEAGKVVRLALHIGGDDTPEWVMDNYPEVKTIYNYDNRTGEKIWFPAYWDAAYLDLKIKFYNILGQRYKDSPAVFAMSVSMADANTGDWSFRVDDEEQYQVILGAGFTENTFIEAHKRVIDGGMNAFEGKYAVTAIGGLSNYLYRAGVITNRHYALEQVMEYAFETHGDRLIIAKGAFNATTPNPNELIVDETTDSSVLGGWENMWKYKSHAAVQNVWGFTQDNQFKMNGGIPYTQAEVPRLMDALLERAMAFEFNWIEPWDVDLLNPDYAEKFTEIATAFKNVSATFDSKVEPVLDYTKITTSQLSEFKLFIENNKDYEFNVIPNEHTTLSTIEFNDSSNVTSSCETVLNNITCTLSASPSDGYITAKITSSAVIASNFSVSVSLTPADDGNESDWSSNSAIFPEADVDGDKIDNVNDTDDDGDTFLDSFDAFPFYAAENLDTDLDGLGNNADADDDNDGVEDALDAFPLNASESVDTDLDGLGNNADTDDDNDGVEDPLDAFPLNASESVDTDLDGIGNNADTDDDNDGLPDSYEIANGLDSMYAQDGGYDNDNDSLTNLAEYLLGTDINNADSDGDGVADNIDENPLDFDEVESGLYSGEIIVLPDLTADGVAEIGILNVDLSTAQIRLEILNGKDQVKLDEVVWADKYANSTLSLHIIPDMNDNGVAEVGLFGIQDTLNNEEKPQMFVRDLKTGNKVGEVYNWVANWYEVSALVMDDLSGDGIAEIAIQGRFIDDNRPQLIVKVGNTNDILDTYSYPDLFDTPQFYQHSDVNGDGFPEVGLAGLISGENKAQIKLASGIDSDYKMKAYNFPNNWTDTSWVRLDDSNGDGIDDWGLFGTNINDGRPQLINKNGTNPVGALRIFAWPKEIQNAQFYRIPDMNNDGVDEVAVAGQRSNNGRYQFQVQNGVDRNLTMANHNLNLDLVNVTYHVLPDLSGDEKVEIGFLGINPDGEYELVIQHGDMLNGEFNRYVLGSNWLNAPIITTLGDTNDDGLSDLLIYGHNASDEQLVFTSL